MIIMGGALFALVMVIFVITFINFAQKRHYKYKQNVKEIKALYDKELLQSKIEVQNSALQHISEEIHDNVGQLLSIVKLNLSAMDKEGVYNPGLINSTRQILNEAINETRDLSRGISVRAIEEYGLETALEQQLGRVEKSGRIKTELAYSSVGEPINAGEAIIIFRVVQESVQNAIKHSDCNKIEVNFNSSNQHFHLEIKDNGTGFNVDNQALKQNMGQGLGNLRHKADILESEIKIVSAPHTGTSIVLQRKAKDEQDKNSFS